MIGSKTGKIISYDVRNKSCRICENAALSKEPPRQHDCRKNWDGSAKGMECDMAVSMLKDLEAKNISIETIVMDDDTTTIARARKGVKARLKKKSDADHAQKHFTNKLYGLQIAKK
ncbi:uncharacterized protein LOC133180103 [Saccostrea echinata]|uniref:uncharacterized protein LOC133180103 n=1 Tax=Saccostrea echinata TaxID=191078 RepID=UPI002A836100|nr:uncharacterized protein LOC133180103 [Saccostrea echinata]